MLIGDLNVPIRTLTTGKAVGIAPTATLVQAAHAMDELTIGLLVVEHPTEGTPIGVISERDICRAVAEDRDLHDERVSGWMTDDLLRVEAETTARQAAYALLEADVRHLLVDEGTWPAGIVSSRDVLAAAMASDAAERRSLLG